MIDAPQSGRNPLRSGTGFARTQSEGWGVTPSGLSFAILALFAVLISGCSSTPPPAPQTLASRAGYTMEHVGSGVFKLITAPIQDFKIGIVTPSGITVLEIDNRAPGALIEASPK